MAHTEQKDFCLSVRHKHPKYFTGVNVVDCGSLDINGNNRFLFTDSKYIGIDIVNGKNVDIVASVVKAYTNEILKHSYYDVVISTEMLEHDKEYKETLKAMFEILKPNGLLIITCATTGRREHGTKDHSPKDSPLTNDYYKNLTEEDFRECLNVNSFHDYEFQVNGYDLYFYGIKR